MTKHEATVELIKAAPPLAVVGTSVSGAGGSWTSSITGIAGAAGGAGFIEIAFIGAN